MRPVSTRANRLVVLPLLALVLAAGPLLLSARPARAGQTFVVTSVGDQLDPSPADRRCDVGAAPGAQCTLRAAIQTANAAPGPDAIDFNIPGDGVQVIRPSPALPIITDTVTIDGYSQPGSKPSNATVGTNATLRISLNGLDAGETGHGLIVNAPNSLIRGLAIGRFNRDGIQIGRNAAGTRVLGCFIGTDPGGTLDRGNSYSGVAVRGVEVTIGGATPGARNLISGNGRSGIFLSKFAHRTRIFGNLIGTDRTGTVPLPNDGSGVSTAGDDTFIGGNNAAAEANVIRYNEGDGVRVVNSGDTNRILRNAIAFNGGLGISLGGSRVNDDNDADVGPNFRQNYPVITEATGTRVRIVLEGRTNQTFAIRLFSNPGDGDEGNAFHGGPFFVTTDDQGSTGPVDLTPDPPIAPGRTVTATATRGNGDTSEFSAAVPVT